MRRRLVAWRNTLRLHQRKLVNAAYHAAAGSIGWWSLLVMLRASLPNHADGLWVLSFAHDLLHGIPIRGWRLSALPLYFPELLSVVTTGWLGFSPGMSLLIHGFISWVLIGAGIHGGLRLAGLRHTQCLRVAFATMLVYVVLHCGSTRLQVFQYPFSHGGAALGTFLGLLYIGRGLQSGFRWQSGLGATMCLGLLCASNRAILAQFVAPALLIAAVFWALRWAPRRRLLEAIGMLGLGPLLGWLVTAAIRFEVGITPAPVSPRLSWSAARLTLSRLVDDLVKLAVDAPFVGASILVPVVLLAWSVYTAILERRRASRAGIHHLEVTNAFWLSCSGLAALIATLGAVVATHAWVGASSQRYILPVLVLPLPLAMIVCVSQRPRLAGASAARALELALLILVVLVAQRAETRSSGQAILYEPGRACLDGYLARDGLHAGYAQYWHARPEMVLGRTQVTVAQVGRRVEPYAWLDNAFWSTRGYWPTQPERPRFDFVISPRLDMRWVEERFGPPRTKHSCFGSELWVYDRPADLEFRNYLRSYSARKTGDHDGWWEAPRLAGKRTEKQKALNFEGEHGALVRLPRVSANVLEIVSPTRKPLELSYQRDGAEIARQQLTFPKDSRRLVALPASLGANGYDGVLIRGSRGSRYRVERIVLMWDPDAESVRP